MRINYTRSAIIDLQMLPRDIQKRIAVKTKFFANADNPIRFAEHLTNHKDANFRFRVGEYRVMFDVVDNTIFILKIKHRKDIYK
ncbi:type II toxin-antitoxin system RelE/ParE family toxin [Candidatus Nomurabacteria bacterium]|nr:type II toxin-antitoxin system RelE/ParE family toxin [Candidatus Nomurabacteria bacterium]